MTTRILSESPIAAVSRVLLHATGAEPSPVLAMQLIDAVRETTPPPREVTIGLLTKILQSLDPDQALDDWATRSAREIVKILSEQPAVRQVAALGADERLWCTLEGTIAGLLMRVCRGQDLASAPALTPDTPNTPDDADLSDEAIAAAFALCAAATACPWQLTPDYQGGKQPYDEQSAIQQSGPVTDDGLLTDVVSCIYYDGNHLIVRPADIAFIVGARTGWPVALRRVVAQRMALAVERTVTAKLRAELAAMTAARDEACTWIADRSSADSSLVARLGAVGKDQR